MQIQRLEQQLIGSSRQVKKKREVSGKSFESVLKQMQGKDENIKFSKHALDRMGYRDMTLSQEEFNRLRMGFNRADKKGVKDALILMGDKAFIASIKNKTVITTVNSDQLKDNVFTNIDGAVIV